MAEYEAALEAVRSDAARFLSPVKLLEFSPYNPRKAGAYSEHVPRSHGSGIPRPPPSAQQPQQPPPRAPAEAGEPDLTPGLLGANLMMTPNTSPAPPPRRVAGATPPSQREPVSRELSFAAAEAEPRSPGGGGGLQDITNRVAAKDVSTAASPSPKSQQGSARSLASDGRPGARATDEASTELSPMDDVFGTSTPRVTATT